MSTRYVERAVREMRENPDSGASTTLLLGVRGDSILAVEEKVESVGGKVTERLPFNTLEVRVPESSLADILEMDGLESVETDESLEDLDRGNLDRPRSLSR